MIGLLPDQRAGKPQRPVHVAARQRGKKGAFEHDRIAGISGKRAREILLRGRWLMHGGRIARGEIVAISSLAPTACKKLRPGTSLERERQAGHDRHHHPLADDRGDSVAAALRSILCERHLPTCL